ncbi:HAD-like protein [Backusella circina FSU 941]|nr:HAD-like protein [Backusella circina FSU 941]
MTPKQWWKELVYATFINSGVLPKDIDIHYDTLFDRLYYRFTNNEGYAIFPEVPSALDELKKKGFKMGVISNSDERVIQVMENLKLRQYFDFILTSSIAGFEKPDKQIFEQAMALAGNIAPRDTLHVGDDIKA